MSMKSLLDVPAPAKLNLFLHVLGRRPDGYHLLQSAFVLIDWYDTLHFELRTDGRLSRHDLSIALPPQDLCWRAAHALQQASGSTLGCDISIDKQLPSGAGMGGGSSDAATVLLALNRLWGLNWSRRRLQTLALSLGADVPFFVGGHNAWVEGVGEELTPLRLNPHWMVVVKPACHTDTGRIFSSPSLVRENPAAILRGFVVPANLGVSSVASPGAVSASAVSTDELFQGFGRNDLQPVVEDQFPEVAQAAALLRRLFARSRMTGSGSAVFATLGKCFEVPHQGESHHAGEVALLEDHLPANWSYRVCRSLVCHPLENWVLDDEDAD
jgi:4-diphosphocytidyl-2-C-methyl-D-erythritol kinase